MTDITNKRMTDPPPPPSTKLPRVSSMSSMVTVAKAGRPFCDICTQQQFTGFEIYTCRNSSAATD